MNVQASNTQVLSGPLVIKIVGFHQGMYKDRTGQGKPCCEVAHRFRTLPNLAVAQLVERVVQLL